MDSHSERTRLTLRRARRGAHLVALCLMLTAASASAATEAPYAPIVTGQLTLSEASFASIAGSALPQMETPYVDGISDQSLADWDSGSFLDSSFPDGSLPGGLSSIFHGTWTGGLSSHITLARYVVQWNVMSGGYPEYLAELESWYAAVLGIGLTPEVSLASYDGTLPSSVEEYQTRLKELLDRLTGIRYLEAWNEPNATAGLSAAAAAHYTTAAYALCQRRGCTVIAGNFLDSQSNLLTYEHAYEQALHPAQFTNWGIHPYYAVKTRSASTVLDFRSSLPGAGGGKRIWFTEVGAYQCEDYGRYTVLGEREQALDASWLVNRLMPAIGPVHVFYYEFLFKRRQSPPCDSYSPDTALYIPSSDPSAPDAPRAAASYIYDGRGVPSAYTGAATADARHATLDGSVYPGGFLDAGYHFEYGTTADYGSYSSAGDAGSGLGGVGAAITIGGLRAGTTYHYRIVSWNAEGYAGGSDRTFMTPLRLGLGSGSG